MSPLISSFPSFCNCSGHNLHVNRLRLSQVIFSQHLPQAALSAIIMRHLLTFQLNTLVYSRHSGRNGGGRRRSEVGGGRWKSAEVRSQWRSLEVGGGRRRSADVGSRRRSVEVGGGRWKSAEVGGFRKSAEVGGSRRR